MEGFVDPGELARVGQVIADSKAMLSTMVTAYKEAIDTVEGQAVPREVALALLIDQCCSNMEGEVSGYMLAIAVDIIATEKDGIEEWINL